MALTSNCVCILGSVYIVIISVQLSHLCHHPDAKDSHKQHIGKQNKNCCTDYITIMRAHRWNKNTQKKSHDRIKFHFHVIFAWKNFALHRSIPVFVCYIYGLNDSLDGQSQFFSVCIYTVLFAFHPDCLARATINVIGEGKCISVRPEDENYTQSQQKRQNKGLITLWSSFRLLFGHVSFIFITFNAIKLFIIFRE